MNSKTVMEKCPGLTYRQLNYWTNNGAFGPDLISPGQGHYRSGYTEEDLRVARTLYRVADAVDLLSGLKGATMPLLMAIAQQVRNGEDPVIYTLSEGLTLQIEIQ